MLYTNFTQLKTLSNTEPRILGDPRVDSGDEDNIGAGENKSSTSESTKLTWYMV